jgi:hypothetical protein
MSRLALILPLFGLGCAGGSRDTGTDTDTAADTDTDSDADTDTDTDTGLATTWNWDVQTLEVADRTEGYDLDGDGDDDNALWVLASVIDPVIAGLLTDAARVIVLQVSDLDDWTTDDEVHVGLFTGADTDGDPTDNYSGTETFDAGAGIDTSGVALVTASSPLDGGRYEVVLLAGSIPLGDTTLETASPIHIGGKPAESLHRGSIGFGLSVDTLVTVGTAAGLDSDTLGQLSRIADLDTDGDGTDDAISCTFTLTAPSCAVE